MAGAVTSLQGRQQLCTCSQPAGQGVSQTCTSTPSSNASPPTVLHDAAHVVTWPEQNAFLQSWMPHLGRWGGVLQAAS